MKYLFKVTLAKTVWYRGNPLKPIYVVAASKEAASEMVGRYLRSPEVSVKSVSMLAKEMSAVMFSANS